MAGIGLTAMIVQGGLVRPIAARTIGFFVYGFAHRGLGIPFKAFWGLTGPATQALMSRRVNGSEQGQLQGALASINGMTGLIGPTLFSQIFAYFINL